MKAPGESQGQQQYATQPPVLVVPGPAAESSITPSLSVASVASVDVSEDASSLKYHQESQQDYKVAMSQFVADYVNFLVRPEAPEEERKTYKLKLMDSLGAILDKKLGEYLKGLAVNLAACRSASLLKDFLDAGYNPFFAEDGTGSTPIVRAALNKNIECLELLLNHMGSRDEEKLKEFVNRAEIELSWPNGTRTGGGTPLSYCAGEGLKGHVLKLIEAGADPNLTGKAGQLPLNCALSSGSAEVVLCLLDHGADFTKILDKRGSVFKHIIRKIKESTKVGLDDRYLGVLGVLLEKITPETMGKEGVLDVDDKSLMDKKFCDILIIFADERGDSGKKFADFLREKMQSVPVPDKALDAAPSTDLSASQAQLSVSVGVSCAGVQKST